MDDAIHLFTFDMSIPRAGHLVDAAEGDVSVLGYFVQGFNRYDGIRSGRDDHIFRIKLCKY